MKKVLLIVGVVIIAGASFWDGTAYQKAHAATPTRSFTGGAAGRFGAGAGAAGFTTGQIVAQSSGSITVEMSNGSSKIVLVNNSTPIMKSTSGTLSDLAMGTTVVVTGSANPDGSITAQSIQIRPAGSPGLPAQTTPPTQQ